MTVTDLRIKFRMETGEMPMFGKDARGKDTGEMTFLPGYPRSNYGRWLEEKLGKDHKVRQEYFDEVREKPTNNFYGWDSNFANHTPPYHYDRAYREVLYKDYIDWLEEKYLSTYA